MHDSQAYLPTFAPLFRVPPHAVCFGRDTDIAAIADYLVKFDSTVVVTGNGGLGKTHLAVALAHALRTHFAGGIYWFDAAEPQSLAAQIAASGGAEGLALPDWNMNTFEEQLAQVQHAWRLPMPRLLIFDNLHDPQVLAQWQPPRGGCRILVTSRREMWPHTATTTLYELRPLPREYSRTLLTHRMSVQQSTLDESDGEVVDDICSLLGDEPLALTLAAAFLAAGTGHDVVDYRQRVQTVSYNTVPDISDALARSFAVTYELFGEATDTTANDLTILRLAANCATAPIPDMLLLWGEFEADAEWDEDAEDVDYVNPFTVLNAHGLLKYEELYTPPTLTCHPLIAALVRSCDTQSEKTHHLLRYGLLQELQSRTYSPAPRTGLSLIPHVFHIVNDVQSDLLIAQICDEAGLWCERLGDYRASLMLCEKAYHFYASADNPDKEAIANSLNNLGWLHANLHDYEPARAYLVESLAIREEILGVDDIDTRASRNNLAIVLRDQGDLSQARQLLEYNADLRMKRNLPEDYDKTGNLALVLHDMGDYATALPLFQHALASLLQSYGEAYEGTAHVLNNIGLTQAALGQHEESRRTYERALAIREKLLGSDHPDVAQSLNNIATALIHLEEYAEARPLLQRSIVIRKKIFGEHDPLTAQSLLNLAILYYTEKDYVQAQSLYEQCVSIDTQTLGAIHPKTAQAIANLALVHYMQANYVEALRLEEQALAIREKSLGTNHPDVAWSLLNMVATFNKQERYEEAQQTAERALAINRSHFAPEHPQVERAVRSLAGVLKKQGKTDEAMGRGYTR